VTWTLNGITHHNKIWGELFLRIDMHQKEKKESGKYLDKNWTKAKKVV
jgi:hypothetical protein